MRSSPVRGAGAALAAVVVTAAACGESGYQYVKNDEIGVYARLPDDWTVFDEGDLFPDDTASEAERREQRMWLRAFDAGDDPSVDAADQLDGSAPAGVIVAQALTPAQSDGLSLATLRGRGDPAANPLTLAETDPRYEVMLDEPVEFEGGFTGVHTVYMTSAGGAPRVVDQTALRNSTSTAIFLFVVGCTEECYSDTHSDEIADLVDSWTIQEVRS